jgi:hypothetical protein
VIRAVVVPLEGPLEVVDSLAGIGSRATYHAEARMLVQPSREVICNNMYIHGK